MTAPFESPLQPGTIIELSDLPELVLLEDLIANTVDPDMTNPQRAAWDGRKNIRELIRPDKFNGRFTDISLEVRPNAYARLIDARERGWKFQKGVTTFERTSTASLHTLERYLGLLLSANAKSSGRPIVSQIQAELWYFPVTHYVNPATGRSYGFSVHDGGASVKRAITQPRIEKNNFRCLEETSKRIGFSTLRLAMLRAKSQPFRN